MSLKINQKLNAKDKVALLLGEGATLLCDDTVADKKDTTSLPEWYDEVKFKRGQQFYHDYIYGMFIAKFCGLLTILAIPSILKILIHTNMSGKPLTAYKRYVATVLHVNLWYQKDFKPGSKAWNSLIDVRNKHDSASRKGCKSGIGGVTQKDMALTQFGFIGYIMTKPDIVGIFNAKKEEYEAFVHVWRVIGYLLGIEDRFNICSGTAEETRQVCDILRKNVFAPALCNLDNNFVMMANALIDGMWCFNPGIEYQAFMFIIFKMCDISNMTNNNKEYTVKSTNYTKFALWFFNWETYLYGFYLVRLFFNAREYLSLWLIEYFPFLAYYRFGYKNSHVVISPEKSNNL